MALTNPPELVFRVHLPDSSLVPDTGSRLATMRSLSSRLGDAGASSSTNKFWLLLLLLSCLSRSNRSARRFHDASASNSSSYDPWFRAMATPSSADARASTHLREKSRPRPWHFRRARIRPPIRCALRRSCWFATCRLILRRVLFRHRHPRGDEGGAGMRLPFLPTPSSIPRGSPPGSIPFHSGSNRTRSGMEPPIEPERAPFCRTEGGDERDPPLGRVRSKGWKGTP